MKWFKVLCLSEMYVAESAECEEQYINLWLTARKWLAVN
jgi:hypothetical protein